jgi:DNA-binding IclR family transcriptional regulator
VQSVERAFHLLELLAEEGDSSLTELSASIVLPAPTTHRFLKPWWRWDMFASCPIGGTGSDWRYFD